MLCSWFILYLIGLQLFWFGFFKDMCPYIYYMYVILPEVQRECICLQFLKELSTDLADL